MNKLRIILQYKYLFYLFLIICIIISFIRLYLINYSFYNTNTKEVTGYLYSKYIDGDKFSFILEAKEKIKCTYYFKTEEEKDFYDNIPLGTSFNIKGTFKVPVTNTIFNTFNYKKYLKSININWTVSVDNINIINNHIPFIYKIRNMIIERIKSYKSSEYLLMFILGDKSLIDGDTYGKYSNLGVTHVFAISGLHISLLSSILLLLLKKFKDNYKYFIVISFLLFYMFLTGFQPSIVRSVVFFIVLYLNKKLYLDMDQRCTLLLSVGIILLVFPYFIINLGFIYSSIISFSLIFFNYLINGSFVSKSIKISLISFLVSLPITINSSYEVNILSFLNNLFFVPFISFVIYPLCLISLIIPFLDSLLFLLLKFMEYISNYLLVYKVIIPKMSVLYVVVYYFILYIFFRSYKKKYLLFLISLLIFIKYNYFFNNIYYVYYLDVGQGDTSLIKYKNKTYLIDTGGVVEYTKEKWKVKKEYKKSDTYITFFKSIGLENIDYLIITHGDYDHMGDSVNLVNNFKVDNVIFNCGSLNKLEKELIKVLDNKQIKYYSCITKLDNLYFLQTKEFGNENDNSNVIYTELYDYKFMFMGDASITTEKEILDKYNLLKIDVLKVGHHGSKTSSSNDFIEVIKPDYSIISVGKNNRYGHPNKEVLDNLDNSKIYRTDQDGSIMFKIKINKLKIETCSP